MSCVPAYRRHTRGYGYVYHRSIRTRDHRLYLGKHNSPESIARYRAFLARLEGGAPAVEFATPQCSIINEVVALYLQYARQHYKRGDGLSYEFNLMESALSSLATLYGESPVVEFGPKKLKRVRSAMAKDGLARSTVNHDLSRIKRMFRWASEEEVIPPELYSKLTCVKGLYRGQENCLETEPVKPARVASIEALIPFLSPTVAALLRVQFYCGMRPGEACIIRACDIDKSGEVWLYRPQRHKTAWRGFEQVKAIPKVAQRIIEQSFRAERNAYLFSPADSMAWHKQQRLENRKPRKTKRYPCEVRRLQKKARNSTRRLNKQLPGDCYTSGSYCRALTYGFERAEKAGVIIERFVPNQVRHTIGTLISQQIGQQAAQRYLGHENLNTTSLYTERQIGELIEVATQFQVMLAV